MIRFFSLFSLITVRFFVVFIYILSFTTGLFAIDREKQEKILWPMEMKVPISGSFAEFRNTHMHMGCDFKTFGINGFPVLSIFDGTIRTMSYSENGYGLTLILFSPNLGLTARIAHLNDLNGDISGLEDLKHSLRLLGNPEGFSINLKPEFYPFPSGAKLARSGETGSGVSHLHLEVWDTQGFINPLILPKYTQKDTTPPIIQTVYIDSNKSNSLTLTPVKLLDGKYSLENTEEIKLSGKVKFRVGGYDIMTSRNRNNVYGIRLSVDDRIVYSKILDRMTFKDSGNRDILYDVNKSSLSPPVYVYNFFNQTERDYSIDLSDLPDKKKLKIDLVLFDSSGNESNISLPVVVSKENNFPQNTTKSSSFSSPDKKLNLDFSKARITSDGFIKIEKLDSLPDDIKAPGFMQVGTAYDLQSNNFSWKGEASGSYEGSFPEKEDSLYVFDKNFKRWVALPTRKQGDKVQFTLSRIGILVMMKDRSPPTINFPYLVHRDYNLPELKDKSMLEKFYSISDLGSGITSMTVLLEGSNYPFEYDKDRGFIKIEVPLNFKKFKPYFIVQLRVQDKAGNKSDWFTDLLVLE